ncbi:hypothetical protein [Psychromonas sp. Urea-02u-13]|uniref:hypothetical protein n=1 Tax=Psychromonas sp. Urea-02u-13 TaxID=2058326 RepID=UPI000C334D4C|nr:hypothetical protein [Psychromonas sp. Urea-02u-13]PKG40720.1 hypothetical protein CXF74_01730 [Psychromonas sp. Urea-02u-13]
MRFLSISTITLLALLLTACGGSLDGDKETEPSVPDTDVPVVDPEVDVPIIDEETGKASYFSYEGVSSDWITIKGVGAVGTDEVATVSFKIADANREGIEGEVVNFELINPPTGTVLAIDTATSDENGLVSTLIKSGYAAGSVIVKVMLVSDSEIYKSSNKLSISTGYPVQAGFTLAKENHSPEALESITSNIITVYLSGGVNLSAVPDGTTVYFSTNSGRITDPDRNRDFCTTVGSECTMEWKSTKPHVVGYRALITAYTDGEESFTDSNRDGLYTQGEAFTDINGDGKYTGMLCSKEADTAGYCVRNIIELSTSAQIVISGSDLSCDFTDEAGAPITEVDLTTATGSDSVKFVVSVSDENNNIPPSDTTISMEVGNGELEGTKKSWTVIGKVANSFDLSVTLKREAELNDVVKGNATFTMITPKGIESFCSIPVVDDAAPVVAP